MSTAPVVCVMVGTTPPGHLQPDMPPLNVLTADCMILSCTVAVPLAGCVNVRAQVEPLVSVTFCLLPLTGSIVLAVVQVPFENSALVMKVVACVEVDVTAFTVMLGLPVKPPAVPVVF